MTRHRDKGGLGSRQAFLTRIAVLGGATGYAILTPISMAVIVTGFILDFPNFGQTRPTMQIAYVLQAVLAIIWISFAFGHIYIGTIGTEGALQAMIRGRVSGVGETAP